MGYDMRWRKIDPSEEAEVIAAGEIRDQALSRRDAIPASEQGLLSVEKMRELDTHPDDHRVWIGRSERYAKAQDAVMAAAEDVCAARVSYFRLDMSGMGRFADVMYELGMTFDDDPHPPWPEIEEYGITWDELEQSESPQYYEDSPPLTGEQVTACKRYRAERDKVLAFHGRTDTPGIPETKFSSNDGWIVLPAECEAALRIYTAKLEEVGQDAMHNLIDNKIGNRGRWAQWLAYLNGAITHDGFEVH